MSSIAESQHKQFCARLAEIRRHLGELRKDRTAYVRSADVLEQYELLANQIRAVAHMDKDTDEQDSGLSRVYLQIRDCFLLISLFFLVVGKNNEPPATYATMIVIKRVIQHLTESGNFSAKDLIPIERKLGELKVNLENGRKYHRTIILDYLEPMLEESFSILAPLKEKITKISPELIPIHEKLVSIGRSIKGCEARSTFPINEVRDFKRQLDEIEAITVNGKFLAPDGSEPSGQEIVAGVLKQAQAVVKEALEKKGAVAPSLRPIADKLFRFKSQLERISVTQAWSLRETDLYDFITGVRSIDKARVNGKFVDASGKSPEEGQSIMLYIVRKCYMHIFSLIVSSEPVSEGLTPVYNQLQTVRRCLTEVQKSGGISSMRDLYPYSMKLASIDNMRVDGKFMLGDDIPEGQGRVNTLLAECFEILADLRAAAEEASSSAGGTPTAKGTPVPVGTPVSQGPKPVT